MRSTLVPWALPIETSDPFAGSLRTDPERVGIHWPRVVKSSVDERWVMKAVERKKAEPRRGRPLASVMVGLVCALLLTLAAGVPSAGAASLATFELIEHPRPPKEVPLEGLEVSLSILSGRGGAPDQVVETPFEGGGILLDFFGGISFSPDGSEIAFTAEAKPETEGSRAIYLIDADGTNLRRLSGTQGAEGPRLSPDGTTLAFSRTKLRSPKIDLEKLPPIRGGHYSSTTTWILDLASGKARRLTPWRNGLDIAPGSFSPDGGTLALTRRDEHRRRLEILLRPLSGGPTRVLTELGEEPAFSPDGRRIAFVGYRNPIRIKAEENQDYVIGEIYSIGVDGKGLRRLTDNKSIETSPAWDPSGARIAYVETRPDHSWIPGLANLFPIGNRIRQMNADGTCGRTVRSAPKVALYGVSWRPEADPIPAPIEC